MFQPIVAVVDSVRLAFALIAHVATVFDWYRPVTEVSFVSVVLCDH